MGFALRGWNKPKFTLDTFKDMPLYHFLTDMINSYQRVVYVKVNKNTVVGVAGCGSYWKQNNTGDVRDITIDLKNETVTLHDKKLLDMSAACLHWFFGNWCPEERRDWDDEISEYKWFKHKGKAKLHKVYGRYPDKEGNLKWATANYLKFFDSKEKVMIFHGITMDKDMNILNEPTKHFADQWKSIIDDRRLMTNSQARARYHNKKAQERLLDAKMKDDWTLVEIDDVFKLFNVSERREIIEYFGMDNILATLDHEVVDESVIDGRPYELIIIEIPDKSAPENDMRTGTYLKMTNPSTGEFHFEGVPNHNDRKHRNDFSSDSIKAETVESALAWRDRDDLSYGGYIKPLALT